MPNDDDDLIPDSYTIEEAAGALNVSPAYLVQLLDSGTLPCRGDGDRRCIERGDLLAFKRKRDNDRDAALNGLAKVHQGAGGYD